MSELTSRDLEDAKDIEAGEFRICDFCYASEIEDIIETGSSELRPMKRLTDGCVICQKCIDDTIAQEQASDGEERRSPDACPTTGDSDCSMCSGEYCNTHGVDPCECDTAERHHEQRRVDQEANRE